MGHDISPIGNHNLKTDNLTNLAHDLFSRLDINIEYGFRGHKKYFDLLGENKDDQYIQLGKLKKGKDLKNFILIDENYQLKELHEKYGVEIFYKPEYWFWYDGNLPNEKMIELEKEELLYPTYEITGKANLESKYLRRYPFLFRRSKRCA